MNPKFDELKNRLMEVNDINSAASVLNWDQLTYMPPGGAPARGRQLATLSRIAHEKFIDPAIGRLLDDLRSDEESLPYDSDEASLIRVARREYEKSIKVPSEFIAELNQHSTAAYQAWAAARPANDFAKVLPYLEKTLDYSRRLANYFPGYAHIADPLIDFSDHGMTVAIIRPLFTRLLEQLVPLVQAITDQAPADDACLHQAFHEDQQLAFGTELIAAIGYDFNRGHVDRTLHPFMTKFSLGDVRITTRFDKNFFGDTPFSMLHEAGHALYEQGIRMDFEGTPLAGGTSSGVHESQSRLWENLVGRSRSFWEFFYPKAQAAFPAQFKNISLDHFYRAINSVRRSLIRTESDEVTYNLHVMIRFDLEVEMLEGGLAVRDLAEAWRERYRTDMGLAPKDDKDGVLQDVHWYGGTIGGSFQGYTLGNIMGAQFFAAANQAQPALQKDIAHGQFADLLTWLRENIYQFGRKFTATEIVQRVSGGPLSIDPYIQYLRTKYGELYKLRS
ncbi:MAG TPA: carboxypeptidase M32 [Anaerolineae bacterium]|nr:carboxypeptidase M32 [Anaerolineae bacterium]